MLLFVYVVREIAFRASTITRCGASYAGGLRIQIAQMLSEGVAREARLQRHVREACSCFVRCGMLGETGPPRPGDEHGLKR
jgi:hypothetical protein